MWFELGLACLMEAALIEASAVWIGVTRESIRSGGVFMFMLNVPSFAHLPVKATAHHLARISPYPGRSRN